MTTISAKIIADSVSEQGSRITTMQLRYPRFIHAEFMTHRQLSRNASSSRAIPVSRLIQDILDDTAMPIHWGKNQKGMQADEECSELVVFESYEATDDYYDEETDAYYDNYALVEGAETREDAWLYARDQAIKMARAFDEAGYHKQVVNRLLEPFSHINVVVTATEWSNFFALRRHKDAEPHIHMLADAMYEAMENSKPVLLKEGQWHLPYVDQEDIDFYDIQEGIPGDTPKFWPNIDRAIKCSVARCARVSYMTHEGRIPTVEEDLTLYDRLVGSHPIHASPAEHQATPLMAHERSGNFLGWEQYRKTLAGECF